MNFNVVEVHLVGGPGDGKVVTALDSHRFCEVPGEDGIRVLYGIMRHPIDGLYYGTLAGHTVQRLECRHGMRGKDAFEPLDYMLTAEMTQLRATEVGPRQRVSTTAWDGPWGQITAYVAIPPSRVMAD